MFKRKEASVLGEIVLSFILKPRYTSPVNLSFCLEEIRMFLDLLDLDSNTMMYALAGLLFLWLVFRIFKRHEKPRSRPQVSGRSASWNEDSYSR
jgi:hypothetical protein